MKTLKTYRTVKTVLGMFIVAVVLCGIAPQGLATVNDPTSGGSGGNTIDWYYLSPLTVVENITDLGGGSYRYEYSFVNIDISPIWHLGICTTFVTQGAMGGSEFTGHDSWGGPDWVSVNSMFPEYDARNLDPAILGHTNTWTSPWQDSATSIQVNEAASGYSFIASVFDSSQKYYWYETIASGYTRTNGTGKVATVGQTIPEPATICLLGLGGLALLRRRKG